MTMKDKTITRGTVAVVAFVAFITLLLVSSKPIPPPKVRATRVSGVNNVRSVSLTLTNINALPTVQPGVGK